MSGNDELNPILEELEEVTQQRDLYKVHLEKAIGVIDTRLAFYNDSASLSFEEESIVEELTELRTKISNIAEGKE